MKRDSTPPSGLAVERGAEEWEEEEEEEVSLWTTCCAELGQPWIAAEDADCCELSTTVGQETVLVKILGCVPGALAVCEMVLLACAAMATAASATCSRTSRAS